MIGLPYDEKTMTV